MRSILKQSEVSARLFRYACDLGAVARIFTLSQLSRHPDIAWRSQPEKRASAFLRPHQTSFECLPGPHGQPFRFRLTDKEKRRLGVKFRNVDPVSIHAGHWLAIGDLWQTLTHAGGRPRVFMSEPKASASFDVFCQWGRGAWLVEIQRSPIRKKAWEAKWKRRLDWYKDKGYERAPWSRPGLVPRPALILLTEQQCDTLSVPAGALVCRSLTEFANKAKAPVK